MLTATMTETKPKGKYTMSDKARAAKIAQIKQFNINPINQNYFNSFAEKFQDKPTSWVQYKVDTGAFLEHLQDRDFATVSISEVESFYSRKEGKTAQNCKAHIRSMMIHAVQNNVNGAFEKVSKGMLVYLI